MNHATELHPSQLDARKPDRVWSIVWWRTPGKPEVRSGLSHERALEFINWCNAIGSKKAVLIHTEMLGYVVG